MIRYSDLYNKEHKNAQCPSALGLLEYATINKVASAAIMELIVKSYGLQCQVKLGAPRAFMLSKKTPKALILLAEKQAQDLYGSDIKKSPELVSKQAIYMLCGRDKSNKVKESCQLWRNSAITKLLEVKEPKEPKAKKEPKSIAA